VFARAKAGESRQTGPAAAARSVFDRDGRV